MSEEERVGNLFLQVVIDEKKAKVSMPNPYWGLTAKHIWAPRMMELGEVRLKHEEWRDFLTYFISNVVQRRIIEQEAVDKSMGLTFPPGFYLNDEAFTDALKAWMDEIPMEVGKAYDLFLGWEIWDRGDHHFSPERSTYRGWKPIPYDTPLEDSKEEVKTEEVKVETEERKETKMMNVTELKDEIAKDVKNGMQPIEKKIEAKEGDIVNTGEYYIILDEKDNEVKVWKENASSRVAISGFVGVTTLVLEEDWKKYLGGELAFDVARDMLHLAESYIGFSNEECDVINKSLLQTSGGKKFGQDISAWLEKQQCEEGEAYALWFAAKKTKEGDWMFSEDRSKIRKLEKREYEELLPFDPEVEKKED